MKRKNIAPAFKIFLSGLFIYTVYKSVKLVDFALSRDGFEMFERMSKDSREMQLIKNDAKKDKEKIDKFIKRSIKRDGFIESFDKTRLFAQVYRQREYSKKWAILVHGYSANGNDMMYMARKFFKLGYNVLLPDCRGHGKSEGDYVTMGWHDRLDLVEWVNKIVERDKYSKILLYGYSMGAATVMMASGEDLPKNVKCIIEDCGYSSVVEEFSYQLKKLFKLPRFPFIHMCEIVSNIIAGYKLSEASCINQVKKCKTPLLFIHGEKDEFVPTHMVHKLYEAATCEKELFIVKNAGHGVCENIGKADYWKVIKDFSSKYLN
ncbi:MAG: alpha/beta hydrolase [Defluviitaleaceae bacterium]|nr:alpha/beta hydrolase [Defluviitaleaceae bacterium]